MVDTVCVLISALGCLFVILRAALIELGRIPVESGPWTRAAQPQPEDKRAGPVAPARTAAGTDRGWRVARGHQAPSRRGQKAS